MNGALGVAYDQGRLAPRFIAQGFRNIGASGHAKKSEQRRFRLAQHDRPPANNGQVRRRGGIQDPLSLGGRSYRKDAREYASGAQMARRGNAVIADVSTRLKSAGDLLWMITFRTATRRKIRRAPQYQVEFFFWRQTGSIAKIAKANVITVFQTIPSGRFPSQPHALSLRLDG